VKKINGSRRRRKLNIKVIFVIIIPIFLLSISLVHALLISNVKLDGRVTAIQTVFDARTAILKKLVTTGNGLYQEGQNYYFKGTSAGVQNYFVFNKADIGNANATWRIIGIDSNGIKIIKNTSIGNRQWHTVSNVKTWSTAAVNTYLNTTYYNSITNKSNIVLNPIWNIGQSSNGTTLVSNVNYQGTTGTPKPVGLINVLEYNKSGGTTSWLKMTTNQWTITARSSNNQVYRITSTGTASSTTNTTSYAIRPVVYLNINIKFTGTGTSADPFVIY